MTQSGLRQPFSYKFVFCWWCGAFFVVARIIGFLFAFFCFGFFKPLGKWLLSYHFISPFRIKADLGWK